LNGKIKYENPSNKSPARMAGKEEKMIRSGFVPVYNGIAQPTIINGEKHRIVHKTKKAALATGHKKAIRVVIVEFNPWEHDK